MYLVKHAELTVLRKAQTDIISYHNNDTHNNIIAMIRLKPSNML